MLPVCFMQAPCTYTSVSLLTCESLCLQVVAITGATGGIGGCAVLLALAMGASKVRAHSEHPAVSPKRLRQ